MLISPLPLSGSYTIDIEKRTDERGFFARTFCENEFSEAGLINKFVQCNVSFNAVKGTLRGMHFQLPPDQEVKLVRCTKGAILDVIIDLRPQSQTYLQSACVELSSDNLRALYVPVGMAHGFVTLAAETEVFYQMSNFYAPGAASGVRWNDPLFKIDWPIEDPILSQRDATYPDYRPIGLNS